MVIYHVIKGREAYGQLGADYFERRKPKAVAPRLARQIEKLGYPVMLAPADEAA